MQLLLWDIFLEVENTELKSDIGNCIVSAGNLVGKGILKEREVIRDKLLSWEFTQIP